VREHPEYAERDSRAGRSTAARREEVRTIAAAVLAQNAGAGTRVQNAVVRDLVERTMRAAEELAVASVLVSGGVAANSQLARDV